MDPEKLETTKTLLVEALEWAESFGETSRQAYELDCYEEYKAFVQRCRNHLK